MTRSPTFDSKCPKILACAARADHEAGDALRSGRTELDRMRWFGWLDPVCLGKKYLIRADELQRIIEHLPPAIAHTGGAHHIGK